MKSNLVVLSVVVGLSATIGQGWAQSQASGPNGIAGSPKVLQMLNERSARITSSTGTPVVSSTVSRGEVVAGPPKVQQMLRERTMATTPALFTGPAVAGYKPTGDDGITASPKLRQILDERTASTQVAPLK